MINVKLAVIALIFLAALSIFDSLPLRTTGDVVVVDNAKIVQYSQDSLADSSSQVSQSQQPQQSIVLQTNLPLKLLFPTALIFAAIMIYIIHEKESQIIKR
jgi:hypothetical protein